VCGAGGVHFIGPRTLRGPPNLGVVEATPQQRSGMLYFVHKDGTVTFKK